MRTGCPDRWVHSHNGWLEQNVLCLHLDIEIVSTFLNVSLQGRPHLLRATFVSREHMWISLVHNCVFRYCLAKCHERSAAQYWPYSCTLRDRVVLISLQEPSALQVAQCVWREPSQQHQVVCNGCNLAMEGCRSRFRVIAKAKITGWLCLFCFSRLEFLSNCIITLCQCVKETLKLCNLYIFSCWHLKWASESLLGRIDEEQVLWGGKKWTEGRQVTVNWGWWASDGFIDQDEWMDVSNGVWLFGLLIIHRFDKFG